MPEDERKDPNRPYFPPFADTALVDMWPEGRSLDAAIDAAAKRRLLQETLGEKDDSA